MTLAGTSSGSASGFTQFAVAQFENPFHTGGQFEGVGDHHQGDGLLAVQFDQELAEVQGRSVVQSASGFIGQQEFGLVNQSPNHGHALAFAPGELAGAMRQTGRKADAIQELARAVLGAIGRGGFAKGQGRKQNIFKDRALSKEVMGLKDKADTLIAHGCELDVVEAANVLAIEIDLPARGPVQSADDVQESALARTGRADNRQALAMGDLKGDVVQNEYGRGAVGRIVGLANVGQV